MPKEIREKWTLYQKREVSEGSTGHRVSPGPGRNPRLESGLSFSEGTDDLQQAPPPAERHHRAQGRVRSPGDCGWWKPGDDGLPSAAWPPHPSRRPGRRCGDAARAQMPHNSGGTAREY